MRSRRQEDVATQLRLRDHRIESGSDPYLMAHSLRSRRSLTPRSRRVEGSRRMLGGDGRSSSLERRNYSWDMGARRSEKVRSRSPPAFGQVNKRLHYDEGVSSRDLQPVGLRRRYENFEYTDVNADGKTGLKYEYEHGASGVIRDKDLDGSRLSGTVGHQSLDQKSVLEDGTGHGTYRFPGGLGPTSKYIEGSDDFSLSSANMDLGWFKNERVEYPDPLLRHKLSAMESYRKREEPSFHSRDVSYSTLQASQSRDFLGTSQFKDFTSTLSGVSRVNFPGLYRDDVDVPLPVDEHPRSSVKLTEPLTFSGYGQKHLLDTGRDIEAEHKSLTHHRQDKFSPTRAEHQDYPYPIPGGRESSDSEYPSDEFYRRMALRERLDYDDRDLSRPSMMDVVTKHVHGTETSHRNLGHGNFWDHTSTQKQRVSNYFRANRSSAVPKQGGDYLDSRCAHLEFGRKVSREQEMRHLGDSRDHEISHMRLNYGFGRDAGPVSYKERMTSFPEFQYETEMHRLAVRSQGVKSEDLGKYDPPNRVLKRNFMDEEMSRHDARSIMSSNWNNSSITQDLNERGEDWIGQDPSGSLLSASLDNDHNLYRTERTFDVKDRHRVSASEDLLSSHDPLEYVQEHSTKPYKHVSRYGKGHPRSSSTSWYDTHSFSRKLVLPKSHNVWIRGINDNEVDMHENEAEQSEEWVSSVKSEPPEDSEVFKQLVHKFFLSFTKKLNDDPAVRKRYKEQGRAGSLFCIVCGRSISKEFMDTQRLVQHAYMSRKVGLRAQHLGLHKAICVMLGWNNVVSSDIITWVPEAISSAEALAQKEDLILWPPVIVIHNSTISDSGLEGQKVITTEALGDFLRDKGFSGGKIKKSFGKTANHDIMLVKFLGTFSGLQDAEKLHKYFSENKHGRKDFAQIATSKSKTSNSGKGKIQGDKLEELLLYGYMGIAEDLDKFDFDTKRKCSIKSKKEIQDLANALIKPG